jgi:ATP-dependent protease ClpP protease subunit
MRKPVQYKAGINDIEKLPVHFINGEIDEENIAKAIEWVVTENIQKKSRLLTLYINSPGGDLCGAFGLIDISSLP